MADITNTYEGIADFDLTDMGRADAQKCAERLLNAGIQKVITSPYKRAKGVAAILCMKFGIPMEIANEIREINANGIMSGVNRELASDIFAMQLADENYFPFGYYLGKSFMGGEDVAEFDTRVCNGFTRIAKQPYQTIAVVTHGGVIRSVYKNLLNRSNEITEIADAATVEIDVADGVFKLVTSRGIK